MTRAGLFAAARRVGIGASLIVGFLIVFAVSGWVVPPYLFILALALPIIGIAAMTTGIDRRYWLAYIIGFVVFAYLRAIADETPIPVQYDYPITLERLVFLGTVPTIWLQQRYYELGSPSVLDLIAVFIHFTYFFVPHLFAFFVWRACPGLFRRYVSSALGCYYGALLTCVLLPTAPPWLAGQGDRLPHVFRIAEDVLRGASPGAYDYGYEVAGTNAVAAMPSLHFAIALLVAIAAWRLGAMGRLLGSAYAATMGFSLVYGGEHYVVDLIAGAVLAVVAWKIATKRGRFHVRP